MFNLLPLRLFHAKLLLGIFSFSFQKLHILLKLYQYAHFLILLLFKLFHLSLAGLSLGSQVCYSFVGVLVDLVADGGALGIDLFDLL
jgi:hypothetical protein